MNLQPLNDGERRDWLRLSRAENVGPILFRQLMRRFGSAAAALNALPELAARGGKRSIKIPPIAPIDDEIARAQKLGVRFVTLGDAAYPAALAAVDDAPPIFSARGNMEILGRRSIGIVGARNASLNGRKLAEILACDLGQNGIAVISGLARGIDTAAHNASLSTGTVAVLAGGVDIVYPEENKHLYDQICEKGCVVSEQPLGLEPFAKLFPRRNRIISGLSLGVVVVEAAHQSGSLITARMALEQGREVFAVPGSPLDPRCAGTNDLIRQGAVLTEKAADILTHIHALPRALFETAGDALDPAVDDASLPAARDKISECLAPTPTGIDDLVRHSQLPPHVVLTVLLELELAGRLERQPGAKVALVA